MVRRPGAEKCLCSDSTVVNRVRPAGVYSGLLVPSVQKYRDKWGGVSSVERGPREGRVGCKRFCWGTSNSDRKYTVQGQRKHPRYRQKMVIDLCTVKQGTDNEFIVHWFCACRDSVRSMGEGAGESRCQSRVLVRKQMRKIGRDAFHLVHLRPIFMNFPMYRD